MITKRTGLYIVKVTAWPSSLKGLRLSGCLAIVTGNLDVYGGWS
jgi:hypothetical protein